MATIDNNSKFIFTKEGRTLLVSQTGGIKFAILGFMLVEGLAGNYDDPSDKCGETPDDFVARWKLIEEKAELNNLSVMDYLVNNTNVTFIMNGVNYDYASESYITPSNMEVYNEALTNYAGHLFKLYYVPSTELMTDKDDNHYGTYTFNFDRTMLQCNIPKKSAYQARHILLIGKQYAENTEAVFNVAHVQKASIVGVAEIVQDTGKGIQILADQNNFVSFQCQLRFTATETKFDDQTYVINDIDSYEPVTDIASKLALVNNGVKTLSGGVTIGQNKEILDELELGPDGAICMTKTLTVADCIDADDAENQFNAAALIHSINKYPDDGGEYIPQVLMTSVHSTSSLMEEITAYSVGMTVKAEGLNGESPIFKLGHVPENDRLAVSIFGCDNSFANPVKDRVIFSDNNSMSDPAYYQQNLLVNSDNNTFINGTSENNNTLYNSDRNKFTNGTKELVAIDSDNNSFSGSENCILIGSDTNEMLNADYNFLIFSDNNRLSGISNMFIDSYNNSQGRNNSEYSLYTSKENILTGNSYNNLLLRAVGNTISGTTTNSLFLGVEAVRSTEDTKNAVLLGVSNTLLRGSYDDILINTRSSKMVKSYFNGSYDNIGNETVSSDQNTTIRSRFFGLKGLPTESIDAAERPIYSDFQSNNNIILGANYFDIFGSSNNLIMNAYKLQSSDDIASLGPVRIKGATIIRSDKSKLFNARDVYVLNSEYTRVNGTTPYESSEVNLRGSSLEMSNTNEIDSIRYGANYYAAGVKGLKGVKGASYKVGVETLKKSARPTDMLRLRTMFLNSYGSELNLGGFVPAEKIKYTLGYNPNYSYNNAFNTLMEPNIRPQNSVILGGHHNKSVGGQNVTILGGEYCKASTYGHQVLMGKFNKDVPADIIYGCGHFDGESYIQGNKEYYENELAEIETLSGTIDGVRGEGEPKCFNALEFYAHEGNLVLRNCDDGHDAGTYNFSQYFGNSVSISPRGITFTDANGEQIGQIEANSNKSNASWTFMVDVDTDTSAYYVRDSIGVPASIASIDKYELADCLFKSMDVTNLTTASVVFNQGQLTSANSVLFTNTVPSELNVVLLNTLTTTATTAITHSDVGNAIVTNDFVNSTTTITDSSTSTSETTTPSTTTSNIQSVTAYVDSNVSVGNSAVLYKSSLSQYTNMIYKKENTPTYNIGGLFSQYGIANIGNISTLDSYNELDVYYYTDNNNIKTLSYVPLDVTPGSPQCPYTKILCAVKPYTLTSPSTITQTVVTTGCGYSLQAFTTKSDVTKYQLYTAKENSNLVVMHPNETTSPNNPDSIGTSLGKVILKWEDYDNSYKGEDLDEYYNETDNIKCGTTGNAPQPGSIVFLVRLDSINYIYPVTTWFSPSTVIELAVEDHGTGATPDQSACGYFVVRGSSVTLGNNYIYKTISLAKAIKFTYKKQESVSVSKGFTLNTITDPITIVSLSDAGNGQKNVTYSTGTTTTTPTTTTPTTTTPTTTTNTNQTTTQTTNVTTTTTTTIVAQSIINKINPWYTSANTAPRYLSNGKMDLNYYYAGPCSAIATDIRLTTTLDAQGVCLDDTIQGNEWLTPETSAGKIYPLLCMTKNKVKFTEFNTNIIYTEWMPG